MVAVKLCPATPSESHRDKPWLLYNVVALGSSKSTFTITTSAEKHKYRHITVAKFTVTTKGGLIIF